MSIVCCKIYENQIEFAADSRVTCWGDETEATFDFSKLIEVNGMIIGGVGECDEMSLMWNYATTHLVDTPDEKSVLNFVVEFMRWKQDLIGKSSIHNHYLLGVKGKVFCIRGAMVFEVHDYYAIGSGGSYAKTALYFDHTPKESVEVACALCETCGYPIVEKVMMK